MKEKQWKLVEIISSIIAVILVAVFFSVLSYESYAWFTYNNEEESQVTLGYASVEIYSNGTLLAGGEKTERVSYINADALDTLGNVSGTGNGIISIKNASNVDMLLRVTSYAVVTAMDFVYVTDADGNVLDEDKETLAPDIVQVNYGSSDWLHLSTSGNNSNMGSYYFNLTIKAQEEVTFISSFSVLTTLQDYTLEIMLTAEILQYERNPYKLENREIPWDSKVDLDAMGWTAYL